MEMKPRHKSKYATNAFWASAMWSVIRFVLIFGMCFIIIYPLLIKLSSSMMTETDLYDLTVKWVPKHFNYRSVVHNYRDVFYELKYPQACLNSVALALMVAVIQLVSCTAIGYGFARFRFFGSNLLFAGVIFTLLVPPQMVMIPLFMNFRFFSVFGSAKINLIGTIWPFVLTSLTGMGLRNGLFIFIMRQFFRGQPQSLEEAAMVDGAGPLRTFVRIMLPGAAPVMLIVTLFSFVWQYNDLFLTSLYMSNRAILLPFMLERLALSFESYEYSSEYMTVITNTAMILFIAPLLILYAFLQRYFVESVERTGIVG